MRLIGTLENEKQAFVLYSFLLSKGIHSTYETTHDIEKKKPVVSFWIYEEDEIDAAIEVLNEFKSNPEDPKFAKIEFPGAPPQPPDLIAEKKEGPKGTRWKLPKEQIIRRKKTYLFTYLVILVCVFFYFLTSMQYHKMVQKDGVLAQRGFTPLQQLLMFDYPNSRQEMNAFLSKHDFAKYKTMEEIPPSLMEEIQQIEQIPTWKGILSKALQYFGKIPNTQVVTGPMFTSIKEGEVWRLFTPCLLHGSFLHILFNMAWAFILLRQVEERLSLWQMALLILILGVVANVAQYLVSGPYFLGFSGVVVGLVGFIWMRQKLAPWEGYPLNKTTFVFILIFVLAMFFLEIVSLITALIAAKAISANIANTAHIIGGLTGIVLGRIPLFARGIK